MKNQQGGFLKWIIILVIAIFLLSYFHIKITDVIDFIVKAFKNVF